MKKKFLIPMMLFLVTIVCHSQDSIATFGKQNVSVGYRLGQILHHEGNFGPLFLKYEYMLRPQIGLGASTYFFSKKYTSQDDSFTFSDGSTGSYNRLRKLNGFAIIPKVNWHYIPGEATSLDPKWELYAGFGIGYGFESEKTDYTIGSPSAQSLDSYQDEKVSEHFVALEINGGARFHFNENFGVYGEVGYGISLTQIGLIVKW